MLLPKSCLGIEICGNDLRFAIMRSHFGKLRLVATHRIGDFMTLSDEDRAKAVTTLAKNHYVPTGRVYLTLPRDQGIVRQVDLPVELGQKLADVIKIQVETFSPWPLDEIYWDFAHEPKKSGRKLTTVTIAIVPRTFLDPWIKFFKSAGLPLRGATLSSLSYAHGVGTLWKDPTVTLILHKEATYTEGIAINHGRVAALTVSDNAGRDAKAFVDRLLSVAKLPSAENSRVIACGGGPDAGTSEENPRLPIENAKPQATADFGAIVTALSFLKGTAFSSNLIPRDLRYRESQLRLIPTYVLVFLAICTGLVLLAREPYQSTAYSSSLDAEIQRLTPTVTDVANQESELNQLSSRWRALTSVLQAPDSNLEALRELTRILPPTAFLTNYSYQDSAITVSGYAQSASEIQSLLENSPAFKGVEFTSPVTREANGKDRFSVKMVIEAAR